MKTSGFNLRAVLQPRYLPNCNYCPFALLFAAAVWVGVLPSESTAGTISGRVTDAASGLPLSAVEIVVAETAAKATTDAAGQFSVEVPGGTQVIELKRAGYETQKIGPVTVPVEGDLALADTRLAPEIAGDTLQLGTFVVEGEEVKNSIATDRRQADVSVDLISAADFAKFTGSDIADIAVRMPGISTSAQGSFAVVRGLSERYNPVMLDGIVLPSSDPERQSPELDIFPARLVDAIVISKTYEPRLPGNSSGAAIDLRTKPLPEGRFLQFQIGIRTDDDYLSNEAFLGSKTGGNWDYLGFGTKERRDEAPKTSAERSAYTRSAVNGTRFENFPLGTRVALTYEDRIVLDEETGRAFGFGISAGQDRTASSESGQDLTVSSVFGTPAATTGDVNDAVGFNSSEYIESEVETRLGALLSAGYAFNKNHQIGVSFFWSQVGTDTHKREFNGIDSSGGTYANITDAREVLATDPASLDFSAFNIDNSLGLKGRDEIYYRQRSLYDGQFKGEHKFDGSTPAEVTWAVATINARQDEPDYYSTPYQYTPDQTFYRANYGGGEDRYARYWRDTEEGTLAGRLDTKFEFDLPRLPTTELRTGYYFDRTERDYNESSYLLSGGSISGTSLQDFFDNLSNYSGGFLVPGTNNPTFATGERTIDAVYGSAVFTLLKDRPKIHKLDLLVGVRLESYKMESAGRGAIGNQGSSDFYQQLDLALGGSGAGFVPGTIYEGLIDEDKVLPAVALNYSPVKAFTTRLSYSRTTARPSFREVGSYFTIDQVTDQNVHGNRGLTTSDVDNYDLRFEYFFPESTDLVALSLFRKVVANPIERVSLDVGAAGPISTWINNPNDAEVLGLELEAAKNLRFLGDLGEYFTLGGNYTYIDATVDRHPVFESSQLTASGIGDERALYDQPDYILNLYGTFDYRPWGFAITLSYFSIGDVLQTVSRTSWDTYVAANDRLDLTMSKKFGKHFSLRASARNLADPQRELIADPDSTSQKVVLRSYRDGRSYTLTAVYDF